MILAVIEPVMLSPRHPKASHEFQPLRTAQQLPRLIQHELNDRRPPGSIDAHRRVVYRTSAGSEPARCPSIVQTQEEVA